MKKELTSDGLLVNSAGQHIPELTFADIDNTALSSVSPMTLEIIKCKRALSRVYARFDYLFQEEVIEHDEDARKQLFEANKASEIAINKILATQIENNLYDSDFKEL